MPARGFLAWLTKFLSTVTVNNGGREKLSLTKGATGSIFWREAASWGWHVQIACRNTKFRRVGAPNDVFCSKMSIFDYSMRL